MPKPKAQKTKTPDSYHHGDLKKALIETAIRMLKTLSPADISLREIARETGVSQAAPFRHFASKEDLLAAIMKEGFEIQSRYMSESAEKYRGDPLERYYQCGLCYLRMGLKHPQHFKLMFNSEIIPDEKYPELKRAASGTFVILRNMITEVQAAGVFGPGDPYHRALNCWSVVHGFTSLYAEGRLAWLGVTKENAEDAMRALLSQSLNGAKTKIDPTVSPFEMFSTQDSKVYKTLMDGI